MNEQYPSVDFFEDLTNDPADWDILISIAEATDPQIRQEVGEISLIPMSERYVGNGAQWVMAVFSHPNPAGSRFSNGDYGVYYAGRTLKTAVLETVHHLALKLAASSAEPDDIGFRVLVGQIGGDFVDLATDPALSPPFLDPADYNQSQGLGADARNNGNDGILYPSVRDAGALAVAVFRPTALSQVDEERNISFHWDGNSIIKYYDYKKDVWEPI